MWVMFWVAVLAAHGMLAAENGELLAQPDRVDVAGSRAVSFLGWCAPVVGTLPLA